MYSHFISYLGFCTIEEDQILNGATLHIAYSIQSTPAISRQLEAKICERELSGSPVISHFRVKAQTCDLQDHSPTLWCLHLLNPNSMLGDNGCTYISWIFSDIDIAPATNHNKPYYILIINGMHQKLSNYTLHKAAYDGICAETIQTMMRFDRKWKWQSQSSRVSPTLCELFGEKFANYISNNADFSITGIKEKQNIIL